MLRRIVLVLMAVVATERAQAQPSEFFDDLYRADFRSMPAWLCSVSPRSAPPPEVASWRALTNSDGRGISCKVAAGEHYFKNDVSESGSTYQLAVMVGSGPRRPIGDPGLPWPYAGMRDLVVEADIGALFNVTDAHGAVDMSEVPDVSLNFWVLLKDPDSEKSASYVFTKRPLKIERGGTAHVSLRPSTDMNDWTCVSPTTFVSGCLQKPKFETAALSSLPLAFGFVLFARGKVDRDPYGTLTIARARILSAEPADGAKPWR